MGSNLYITLRTPLTFNRTPIYLSAPGSTDWVAIHDCGTRRWNRTLTSAAPSSGDLLLGVRGPFRVTLSSWSHKNESYDNAAWIYGHFAKLLLFILLMSRLYAIAKIFCCIHFNAQVVRE